MLCLLALLAMRTPCPGTTAAGRWPAAIDAPRAGEAGQVLIEQRGRTGQPCAQAVLLGSQGLETGTWRHLPAGETAGLRSPDLPSHHVYTQTTTADL